jgi:hypothetical protein
MCIDYSCYWHEASSYDYKRDEITCNKDYSFPTILANKPLAKRFDAEQRVLGPLDMPVVPSDKTIVLELVSV